MTLIGLTFFLTVINLFLSLYVSNVNKKKQNQNFKRSIELDRIELVFERKELELKRKEIEHTQKLKEIEKNKGKTDFSIICTLTEQDIFSVIEELQIKYPKTCVSGSWEKGIELHSDSILEGYPYHEMRCGEHSFNSKSEGYHHIEVFEKIDQAWLEPLELDKIVKKKLDLRFSLDKTNKMFLIYEELFDFLSILIKKDIQFYFL